MNIIEKGVNLYGLKPEMDVAHTIAQRLFLSHGYGCIITSAVRRDSFGSLHQVGYAIDLRSKHIGLNSMKHNIRDELIMALPQYDIILHPPEYQHGEHFHIEFDPKDNKQWADDKEYWKQTGRWPGM